MIYVIKKDGTREEFNSQKIVAAVNKSAARILYTFSDKEKEFICQFEEEHAEALGKNEIEIQEMHNIVEGALESRKTPLGREIADVLLAVNRPYGKSDYIPCICWGRNARYASAFEVGGHVLIWGRIQSREYMKRIGENETEKRVAYEVSVSKLEYME